MAHEFFTPQDTELLYPESALVTLNDFGKTLRGEHAREAQYLANILQLPVLAVERPGSHKTHSNANFKTQIGNHGSNYSLMQSIGRNIEDALDSKGIKASVVAGVGAGGLGALALTEANELRSQVAVYAAEPVGLVQMTSAGFTPYDTEKNAEDYYKEYLKSPKLPRQETRGQKAARILMPDKEQRLMAQNDWENINGALANAIGLNCLQGIRNLSGITVWLEFTPGSPSIELNGEHLRQITSERRSMPGAKDFKIDAVSGTTIYTLCDPQYFAKRLAPLLDQVLSKEDLPDNPDTEAI